MESSLDVVRTITDTPLNIVRGQRGITADTALRLSRFFGTRPGWWLDLQIHYDLETAADKWEARIARAVKPCALLSNPAEAPFLM
jgi:addiction module HigA family antidote